MAPVDLCAFAPDRCEHGHPLTGRGTRLNGWMPCACPTAQASGRLGHQTVTCVACLDGGVSMVFYDPPHDTAPDDGGSR